MLKKLITRISNLIRENNLIDNDIRNLQNKKRENNKLKFSLEQQLKELEEKELQITEHALLRYCERILKINTEEIKNLILSKEILDQIKVLGINGKFVHSDGFRVVVKDNKVVTIEKHA